MRPSGRMPFSTRPSMSGRQSSRPIIPGAASASSQSFSSGECGAWSVAMQSIVPSASAARSASTSSVSRSGGFTLHAVS